MGMSRPSYGRGQGSFFGRRPPPMRNPRMPMPPMNQPQTPSGGGFLAQLGSSPMMQRPMPGGPGKGRPRGRFMRGGPGKGRGQMQQPMPARPSFDQLMTQGPESIMPQLMTQGPMNMPTPRVDMSQHQRPGGFGVSGPLGMPQSPFMTQQGLGQTGQFGQLAGNRSVPAPEFGQRRPQGPMNMPPMNFPQPTLRPDQTMGRPMPQPFGFDGGSFGQMRPFSNIQFQQAGNNRPAPEFMGEVGQARTQGPSSMLQSPFMMQQGGMGFYGGGITDLY